MFKKLFILLSWLGAIFFCYQFFLNFFVIKQIEVITHPIQPTFAASVQASLEKFRGQPLWKTSLSEVLSVMKEKPNIEDVWVWKTFPQTLKVKVKFKNSLLILLDEKTGKIYPVTSDGSLLEAQKAFHSLDFPVLRGQIFFKDVEKRKQAFRLVSLLPKKGLISADQISEVYEHSDKNLVFSLVGKSKKLIYIPQKLTSKKVFQLEKVMNYLGDQNITWRVIDLRFSKKIVVKLRKQTLN